MRPQVRAMREVAAQTCQRRRFPFKDFMNRGLEEILERAEELGWSAAEIACKVLAGCCLTDGKFNGFVVGFLAVITYFNEQLGRLGKGEEQAFKDLRAVLDSPGNEEGIRRWLQTHYPG